MSDELIAAVERLAGGRALVVGDVMLDEYVWGDVGRISPEAPVPIVEVRRRSRAAGGAANAAAGICALGARATLVGAVGDDEPGRLLATAVAGAGVEDRLLVIGRRTTVKTRIIAHSQQVVRVDDEARDALERADEDALLERVRAALAAADVLVLSDYAKGVVTPRVAAGAIELARAASLPVVVDPKGRDFARYRGATVVTPNVLEAELVSGARVGDDGGLVAARSLRSHLGGGAVLITRGGDGMSLFAGDDDRAVDIPASARNVYDVTGAGDAVVSVLALALAVGLGLEEGARLANAAGGVVVGKIGTAAVTPGELLDALG